MKILRECRGASKRFGEPIVLLEKEPRGQIRKRAFKMFAIGMKDRHIAEVLGVDNYVVHKLRKKFSGN